MKSAQAVLVALCLCLCPGRSHSAAINKCCPRDHSLVFTAGGIDCTRVLQDTEGLWWLPQELLSNDTRPLLQVSYDTRPRCATSSMDYLRFDLAKNMVEYALVSEGGDLRLSVFKESTLHDPGVGRKQSFPSRDFCLDVVGTLSVALLCPCREVTCVRKCCHDGRVFNRDQGVCLEFQEDNDNGDFFDWVPKVDGYADYYRLVGTLPKCERFTSHVFSTRLNGSQLMLAKDGSLQALDTGETFMKDEYCGTHSSANEEMVVFCLKTDSEAAAKQIVYGSMFLFGAICLFATVVVTAVLPEMRRHIQGKMALAHNAMLFVGYLVTGISQLKGSTISQSSCEVLSLIIQFTILAAFFWLNAMCVDISWTFSGLQSSRKACLQSDRVKFILYSVYAWGCTAIISTTTIVAEFSPSITRFKPNFGTHMCFFNDDGAELLFFYGPMAVLLAVNVLLFIYIAWQLFSVNQQKPANSKNKQNLVLYGKLFFLMGVTWVTEIISWAVGGPNYFWYFTDVINLLRAVFIFVIFCCKRTVYVLLRNKILRTLGKNVPDPNPSHSTKSMYSNDSSKRAASVATTPAQMETSNSSTLTQTKKVHESSRNTSKTETIEMT